MSHYGTEVNIAYKLISQIDVPVLPKELLELQTLLTTHDIPNIKQIVELISANPYIAAELVSIANMPVFNPPQATKIRDLDGALFRLGMINLRHYILAIHLKNNVLDKGMNGLSYHSQMIASIASTIAELTQGIKKAEAYLLGLVHDIGSFAINQLDHSYGLTFHSKQRQYHSTNESEYDRYGTTHSALGYVMATELKLPTELAQTILLHHEPNIDLIKNPQLRRYVALIEMAHLFDIRSRNKYKQLSEKHQITLDKCSAILEINEQEMLQLNSKMERFAA